MGAKSILISPEAQFVVVVHPDVPGENRAYST